jgi:nucleoside-diphosphate-sugar epimerase
MKILLTGSSGFVGIYLSKKLNELENKYLNQFFQYNLSNFKFNEIKDEPAFKNLDILIHCAAAKGDYKLTSNDFYIDNVKASEGVIKFAETFDIKNIIHYRRL